MRFFLNSDKFVFCFLRRPAVLLALLFLLAMGCSFSGDLAVDPTQVQEIVQSIPTLAETPAYATPAPLPYETHIPLGIPDETSDLEESAQEKIPEPFMDTLEQNMLSLVNKDRQANGLQAVEWNNLAGAVARAHAQEMLQFNYLSHWNILGQGPDVRYGLSGGTEVVQENVYAYSQQYEDGTPIPITDWDQIIRDAERRLMESPGHRDNILNPAHTHVGVGIAYDPQTGRLRLAQEFINQFAEFAQPQKLPLLARPGEKILMEWKLVPPASAPFINLAYQPYPESMEPEELDQTSTYTPPAEVQEALTPTQTGSAAWKAEVDLPPNGQPGYYHILLWVQLDEVQVPVGDLLIEVRD